MLLFALQKWKPPNYKLSNLHSIPLIKGAKLISMSMYRHNPQEKMLIRKYIKELLEVGTILPP